MKEHVLLGDRMMNRYLRSPESEKMVRHHHERYDGSGYPLGPAADQIPIGSRFIAIADACHTITLGADLQEGPRSSRYLDEFDRFASQFDAELVRIFIQAIHQPPQRTLETSGIRAESSYLRASRHQA